MSQNPCEPDFFAVDDLLPIRERVGPVLNLSSLPVVWCCSTAILTQKHDSPAATAGFSPAGQKTDEDCPNMDAALLVGLSLALTFGADFRTRRRD